MRRTIAVKAIVSAMLALGCILAAFPALVVAVGGVAMIHSESVTAADSTTQTELFYDDGGMDFGWATGPFGGGAVLFTPPTTPWVLSGIKVMAWIQLGDAPFYIEIWDSERNELFNGTYMYSDYFTSYPVWAEIEMPDIVTEGDFYVCVFGNWDESHILLLGFDDDPPISYRSFAVRYDTNSIDYGEEWNWMIRAIGESPPSEVWVDDDACPGPGTGTPADPYCRIQDGIDAVASLGTVHVAAGTYVEHINFLGKAITVTSEEGLGLTVIDGNHDGPVVTFDSGEDETSVLTGFTIQNGYAYWGAGITMGGSSPTIIGNIFDSNDQRGGGFGAAIGGNSSSPTIEQNIFRNNTCDD